MHNYTLSNYIVVEYNYQFQFRNILITKDIADQRYLTLSSNGVITLPNL